MKSFLFVSNGESHWPKEGEWSAHLSLPNSQLKRSNRINQEKETSLMLKRERLYLHNSRSEEGCQGQAGTSAPAPEHSGLGHEKRWRWCSIGASEAEEQWVQTEGLWSTFAGNSVTKCCCHVWPNFLCIRIYENLYCSCEPERTVYTHMIKYGLSI